MRSAVVLPEPDGPTSTMNSPSAIVEVERVDRGRVGARIDRASPARSERQPSVTSLQSRARSRTRAPGRSPVRRRARRARASAAPTIGGDAVEPDARCPGRPRAAPPRSRASSRSSRACRQPAAEQHLARLAASSSSRVSAARTSATTSSASRSTISAATVVVRRLGEHERRAARSRGAVEIGRRGSPRRARAASRARSAPAPRCSRRRRRAAAVLAARRRRERGEADVVAAAPVAGDRAERREARVRGRRARRRRS